MARRLPKRGEVVPLGAEAARGCMAHPNAVRQAQDQGFARPQEFVAHFGAVRRAFRQKDRFVYMVAGLYVRDLDIFLIRIGSCI